MRKLVTILLLLPILVNAQPYGQEWIKFNQEYYKITVPDNGIYRINYDDLNNIGFPVGAVDPHNVQIFRKGVEIAINVAGQSDGSFDSSDYIEFYGQKNDGTLDTELYLDPSYQPHTYYNLYADSAAYFLTYTTAQPGKRISTSNVFTGPLPDPNLQAELIFLQTQEYSQGFTGDAETGMTQFDLGEGFSGRRAIEISRPDIDITLTGIEFPDLAAPLPELEVMVVGRNYESHDFELFVGPDVATLVSIGTFNSTDFNTSIITHTINWTDISGTGQMVIRLRAIDNGGDRSNLSISYAKINFARLTNVNNKSLFEGRTEIRAGGNLLLLQNTPPTSLVYEVSDPLNPLLVPDSDASPTTITCGFANGSIVHNISVASPSSSFSLQKARFRSFNPTDYNYLIISHQSLMQPAGGQPDAVRAYGGYRASVQGGSFDTLIVDIDLLYNQFSYGQPTPLAVYNFIKYMANNGNPEHILLVGKGLDIYYKYHRIDPSSASLKGFHDLVPNAGYPGSDQTYTVGLSGDPNNISIPIGRLSVSEPIEIVNYLNKVIEMETTPYNALWRKNLLHLSGGNTALELILFRSYINGLGAVARDHYLGGEVTTISKQTTSSVEFINVSEEVNAGLNLITFFGHSAPNVIDIDIGKVSDPANGYNNQGRYPTLLMNGCNTGNVFTAQYVFVEDWIATANKGATGVLAHNAYGYPNLLKAWTDIFYSLGYADSIYMEKSIGEIMVETGRQFFAQRGPVFGYKELNQVQQFGLQGDPAVKLFGSYTPDYEISANNIEAIGLTNNGITAEADSFALAMGLRNFGAYIRDSLEIVVQRTLQDGSIIQGDTILFPPIRNLDTVVYVINNKFPGNSGINRFKVILDPRNRLVEHDETNNEASKDINIPRSGTLNLSPYPFAIQSASTVDLIIQSGNPLAPSRGYLLELDSASNFNSSVLAQSPPITGSELITWPDLSLQTTDSNAYYWRSKYETSNPDEVDEWAESSFTYIENGDPGWGQVAFPQHAINSLTYLTANDTTQDFDFLETELSIELKVHGANSTDYTYKDTELIIDGLHFILEPVWSICYNNRLNLVAFNKQSATPYAPIPGNQVEQWSCGRSPQVINSFNGGKPLDDILDAIAPGDKVVLFTTGKFDFNTLSAATIAKLEDLGADPAILAGKLLNEPYIMVGAKGAGSGNSVAEIIADPADAIATDAQTISYSGIITGIYGRGEILSTEIGPAQAWSKAIFEVNTHDPSDVYNVDIIGKDLSGNETLLMADIQVPTLDISSIDAKLYPLLKLKLKVEDQELLTAPQLEKWIVNYDPAPEAYLTYIGNNKGGGKNISLQEGEKFIAYFKFINITSNSFTDSVTVNRLIFNEDTRNSDPNSFKIGPETLGDTIFIEINTKGRRGMNSLEVTANPLVLPEQRYENNSINLENFFEVIGDNTNPLLEVSFDGEYIFDGDIVSPNPNIRIVVRDDNEFLLKTDTTGIDIYLKPPCDNCVAKRISLSGSDVVWMAEVENEPFTIDFTPKSLEDGIYELSVQAQDESGNASGTTPYVIHFEVVNKTTVTNFYPYPNPFSTSVKFIFTLTGNEVPDQIMIRIFTVSGRVVREITQDELGPLRIGNNVTDYAWDGRDEFGDQLANGVYLYKVYIRQNGQDVELRSSSGDRGFKNGYGKLYILR